MNIVVRLPNWLGDMIMALPALHQLKDHYPDAQFHIIVKRGLEDLSSLISFPHQIHSYSKKQYLGISGVYRFGRTLAAMRPDIYFCFPDSFSSAVMGMAMGARKRVGYKNEGRSLLLSHSWYKEKKLHRAEEYLRLVELEKQTREVGNGGIDGVRVRERGRKVLGVKRKGIVVNINSEAQSRRLTVAKAVEIVSAVREQMNDDIYLVGGPNEVAHVQAVYNLLPNQERIEMLAGKTTLKHLMELISTSCAMLSTDSGPAHLANALGTPLVVLFGAGNENNTAPYWEDDRTVIRLGKLSCEPCVKNVCIQFKTPQCLELLETANIINEVKKHVDGRPLQ